MEFKLISRPAMVRHCVYLKNYILLFLELAGCTVEIVINNVRVFGNCTCGVDTQLPMTELIATEGACGMDDCKMFWISHQVLSVIATALLGSTLIGKIIISLRAVLPQDKSTALGLELLLVYLIVYLPGKIGYRMIASMKNIKTKGNKEYSHIFQIKLVNMWHLITSDASYKNPLCLEIGLMSLRLV